MSLTLVLLTLLTACHTDEDGEQHPLFPLDAAVAAFSPAMRAAGDGDCDCCRRHGRLGYRLRYCPPPYPRDYVTHTCAEGNGGEVWYDDLEDFFRIAVVPLWPVEYTNPLVVPVGHTQLLTAFFNFHMLEFQGTRERWEHGRWEHFRWTASEGVSLPDGVNDPGIGSEYFVIRPDDEDGVWLYSDGMPVLNTYFPTAGNHWVKAWHRYIYEVRHRAPCGCGHPWGTPVRPVFDEEAEDTLNVTVVEVASLTAAGAKPVTVVVNEVEETHYYLKVDATPGAKALVTALPNPDDVAEADLEGIWTVTRTSTNGAAGKVVPRTTWAKVVDDQVVLKDSFKLFDVHLDTPATHTFLAKCGTSQKKLTLHIVQAKIAKPYGDPTRNINRAILLTEPEDRSGPNASNEIVYDGSTVGYAYLLCEAFSTPLHDRLKWSISPNSPAPYLWVNNGIPEPLGRGQQSSAFFSGLPQDNDDFGLKTLELVFDFDGELNDTKKFELFFTRDATNHLGNEHEPDPERRTPNWFYYWSQIVECENLRYVADFNEYFETTELTLAAGIVPAMRLWSYAGTFDKTLIVVGNGAIPDKGPAYGVGKDLSGIDYFINMVKHEEEHVRQIAKADKLVKGNTGRAFRNGWSWNHFGASNTAKPMNHWSKGQDGAWGVAGRDDDQNAFVDDAKGPQEGLALGFEPGWPDSDDVRLSLDAQEGLDWAIEWPMPGIPHSGNRTGLYVEDEAIVAADFIDDGKIEIPHVQALKMSTYGSRDWGFPGKMHSELNWWR